VKHLPFTASLLVSVVLPGCTVNLSQSESADIVKNQCTQDSECKDGACWFGACVAHEGALSTVLLELTPPASQPTAGIGGLTFHQIQSGLARSNEQNDINLDGVHTVHGYIASECSFEVTVTAEEQSYGLSAATHVTHTSTLSTGSDTTVPGACGTKLTLSGPTQEFVVDLPPGAFDVYVKPTTGATSGDGGAAPCDAVPQFFSGLVRAGETGVSCYPLKLGPTRKLDVRIPWPESAPPLVGWTVDILHPLTGQVLSQVSAPLQGAPALVDGGYFYSHLVTYVPVVADGTTTPGQELLRLSPPTPDAGPVVLLSLVGPLATSAAVTAGPQKAVLPPIGPFPALVHLNGWVWKAQSSGEAETPVPSTVSFTSTDLDMLQNGIFTSFSTTKVVGDDGRLFVDLLPGAYLARAVPTSSASNANLAEQEWSFPVAASEDGSSQGGRTLLVANAATITGQAKSGLGTAIGAAPVQAVAASVGMRRCDVTDAGPCTAQQLDVLGNALGEAAFVPRTASGVTASTGKFTVPGVDCGGCTMDTAASFDVVVRPTDGTRLPWVLRTGVSVGASVDLDQLQGSLPIIQRGKVQVPVKGAEPLVVPGTLIRAYVIRDATGAPILDPTGLQSCSTGTYTGATSGTRCIGSALQVAETRADSDGKYELVLPSSLDSTSR